ncbi:mercuric ion binding protein [Dysgonomonas sp. PH5-45]|uniref:heavy-metal-associated domain-containing protein n=1 Tax=unclassified Dysgonomonas TaxID=2630389 RepID=UPI0024767C8E|nr:MULTISPECIES: heavy metal-associated domain-containing protein [unclassified Dysgonomonas]MDH6354799.1 mercuric ion binding protein [Dysgonomonas sp. PH5-45]MDH6387698.1 mercuric ion binding protein [Dysgonomonas sp. PH5-37]
MKTKIIAFLTLVFCLSINLNGFAQEQKKAEKKKEKEEVLFNVPMHCESCKRKIERNMPYEKGVTDMKVDLASNTVWIEYKNSKTSVDKLQKALEKLGYEASLDTEETEGTEHHDHHEHHKH